MKRMILRGSYYAFLAIAILAGLGVVQGRFSFGQGADVTIGEIVDPVEAEQQIYESLSRAVDLRFEETPLQDVADSLSTALGYPVLLDALALEDVGLDPAVPVTIHVRGVSLRAGLRLMLRELEMDWIIQDEALILSTYEVSEGQMRARLYNVSDLVTQPLGSEYYSPKLAGDASELIRVIRWTVAPDTWDEVGGPGSIQPLVVGATTLLVVDQTGDTHTRIDSLLRRLRDTLAQAPDGDAAEHLGQPGEGGEHGGGEEAGSSREDSAENHSDANPVGVDRVTTKVFRVNDSGKVSAEDYVDLIRLVIDKADWDARDDVFVGSAASSVVVKHEAAVQQAVAHLLTDAGAFAVHLNVDREVESNSDGQSAPPAAGGGLFGLLPSIR